MRPLSDIAHGVAVASLSVQNLASIEILAQQKWDGKRYRQDEVNPRLAKMGPRWGQDGTKMG